jgi:ABC-2 type transport system ATP-binding protein
MPDDVPAVQAVGLRKAFGNHEVLRGLDLEVPAGEVFALLGANGAGKTTTVSIFATLLKPDGGTARVAGFDVVRDPVRVREAVSVTGQNVAVDPVLTGPENLALIARLRHVQDPQRVARKLVERFGLAAAGGKRVGAYSGGMKRRLDIAMSLVGDPAVVFLDEPTTGLDPAGRREVWAAVDGLAALGRTVVLTTQHMEEATRLAGTVAVLHGGAVAAAGRHEEILLAAGGAADLETAFLRLTGQEGGP